MMATQQPVLLSVDHTTSNAYKELTISSCVLSFKLNQASKCTEDSKLASLDLAHK